MVNEKMYGLGSARSAIRELFEFGKRRAAEIGADKVYDFSLGNPSVEPPKEVNEAIVNILKTFGSKDVHGYSSAQGFYSTRKAVADKLNRDNNTSISPDYIYMTAGAAAGLCIAVRALNKDKDEFIILAPYFPEYKVFIEAQGAKVVEVSCDDKLNIDVKAFEKAITKNTKGVIINSPNNPSGKVYDYNTIKALCDTLEAKSKEFENPIYIISDEPYRELVYSSVQVPSILSMYNNTIMCYSYSKSLSIPGDRIGYLAVSDRCEGKDKVYAAINGAGRALGYVCAPTLFQLVIERCIDAKTNILDYDKNRILLYESLVSIGYDCLKPDGAFYLFVKALEEDSIAFCERAKNLGILIVPSDSFGVKGYARIAYCVDYNTIERSLPAFKELFDSYKK
ncbi:MAG TPA: pyridoxal phosphate-dependent aminotransferase [Clostridia bacterium]|nr:pyridoxal phosphate-dependent aminotransferase [Clostridia bacterium]